MNQILGSFKRPYGTAVDIKELEYISALHQTSFPGLRSDGSISATDVRLYLNSRYGIVITHDETLDIVRGLGGPFIRIEESIKEEKSEPGQEKDDEPGRSESELNTKTEENENSVDGTKERNIEPEGSSKKESEKEHYFNIKQMMSIILIPALLQANNDLKREDGENASDGENSADNAQPTKSNALKHYPPNILRDVVQIMTRILTDEAITGSEKIKSFRLENHLEEPESATSLGSLIGSEIDPMSMKLNSTGLIPTLNEDVVRSLLILCNQHSAAKNDVLVRDMVDAAGGPGIAFDEHALGRALTFDVSRWNIGAECDRSTSFFDVFGFERKDVEKVTSSYFEQVKIGWHEESDQESLNAPLLEDSTLLIHSPPGDPIETHEEIEVMIPPCKNTASYIDRAADTYNYILLEVLLWLFYIFQSIVITMVLQTACEIPCDPGFGCTVLTTVTTFTFFGVALSISGLIVILPVSIGGNSTSTKVGVLTILLVLFYTIVPHALLLVIKNAVDDSDNYKDLDNLMSGSFFEVMDYCAVVLGFLLALFLAIKLFLMKKADKLKFVVMNDVGRTARTKLAAIYKIYHLMNNALNLHYDIVPASNTKSISDNVMKNFYVRGSFSRECGGVLWTWRKLWNRELMTKEGIWIHSRLIVGQAAQLISFVCLSIALILSVDALVDETNEKRDKYKDNDKFLQVLPEDWMIIWSFYPAGIFAICVGLYLFFVYLPSTVNTVLKLRCGEIPTLHDPFFDNFRKSADTVYVNTGNMISSFLGSMFSFFLIVALIIFICCWPVTRNLVSWLVAWSIGITLTVLCSTVLTICLRKGFYLAFYRTRPAEANFSALMMEAWNAGMLATVLLTRISIILLVAALYIGRIDKGLLGDDVRVFGLDLDATPINYRKELLVHDAHRHPFFERLGAMYMMRLKYGNRFSSDAGACWRNLFVIALMPWLIKYRVVQKKSG